MMNNPDCSLSFHQMVIFDSDTKENLGIFGENAMDKLTARDIFFPGNCTRQGKAGFAPSSLMLRKISCPAEGFNKSFKVASDFLFIVETALNGYALKLNGIWGAYRVHRDSVCHSDPENVYRDKIGTILYIYQNIPFLSDVVEQYAGKELSIKLIGSGQPELGKKLILKQLINNPLNPRLFANFILIYFFGKLGIAVSDRFASLIRNAKKLLRP